MKKITLGQIAAQTGVSLSCVSFVRHGKGQKMRISLPVIEQVEKALLDAGIALGHRIHTDQQRWYEALEKIAAGHPDPKGLAQDALCGVSFEEEKKKQHA